MTQIRQPRLLKGAWRLLASGIGLLGILLVAPGGLTGLWYDLRDLTLRWFGARRGIVEGDRAVGADHGMRERAGFA